MISKDAQNLKQFHTMVARAYKQAKSTGKIARNDISVYDKLITSPAVVYSTNQRGWVRPVYAHRQWRRQVARMYYRSTGKPVRGLFGLDRGINWEDIWTWILENIVPILRMLLMLVPFII